MATTPLRGSGAAVGGFAAEFLALPAMGCCSWMEMDAELCQQQISAVMGLYVGRGAKGPQQGRDPCTGVPYSRVSRTSCAVKG